MSDLISRQAVIDAINGIAPVDTEYDCVLLDKVDVDCVISDLPSVQPEQRWIPCSERLPDKKRETYCVCTDTGYQCECRWTNNRFGICDSDDWGWSIFDPPQYSHVIAWMPLPEPYKENTNE